MISHCNFNIHVSLLSTCIHVYIKHRQEWNTKTNILYFNNFTQNRCLYLILCILFYYNKDKNIALQMYYQPRWLPLLKIEISLFDYHCFICSQNELKITLQLHDKELFNLLWFSVKFCFIYYDIYRLCKFQDFVFMLQKLVNWKCSPYTYSLYIILWIYAL